MCGISRVGLWVWGLGVALPSRDSYLKASGPKDPIVSGFWAILMLRGRVQGNQMPHDLSTRSVVNHSESGRDPFSEFRV